jgi:hypothetical protein
MLLALLRFGAEDMTQTGFMTLDFAGSRFFEALGSAFVCFQFRHGNQFPVLGSPFSVQIVATEEITGYFAVGGQQEFPDG